MGKKIVDLMEKLAHNEENRRYFDDFSTINRQFFSKICVPLSNVIWRPKSRPCWFDGPNPSRHICLQQPFIQHPKLNLGLIQR